MKKILLAAVALVFAFGAQAQIVSSTSSSVKVIETKQESNTEWFVRAALNLANFAGDDADDLDSKMAYDVTMGFHKPIKNGLFWGMEWGLGSRGYEIDEDGWSENLLAHNVFFQPITFGYKYNFNDSWAADFNVGAYVSYDYAGTCEQETDWGESEDIDIDDLENYETLDYGFRFGLNAYYNNLTFGLRWQRGLSSMIDDVDVFTNNINIAVGLTF